MFWVVVCMHAYMQAFASACMKQVLNRCFCVKMIYTSHSDHLAGYQNVSAILLFGCSGLSAYLASW